MINISVKTHPNPLIRTFHTDKVLNTLPSYRVTRNNPKQGLEDLLPTLFTNPETGLLPAQIFSEVEGVESVSSTDSYSVSVGIAELFSWGDIQPEVERIIKEIHQ